ncbi:ElyC/SanA/YdcF family protein [Actinoplanes sp. NPDC026619]|uniref:SanA/YdcF family protein n=1 Tax=Actinoplanes sp. NPDC026619 TaxID=3155798 RepID=UPI0033DB5FDC
MKIKRLTCVAAIATAIFVSSPWAWTSLSARGHVYAVSDAPVADVAIVLGTEVVDGKPSPRLAGRLEAAAQLVAGGQARTLLVSGDGHGDSGDEPATMAGYLVGLGVPADRIVQDPYGLDTYDSCIRARDVFGVRRALVVTQSYHVDRAVTLCRHLDIDADGVVAPCHCSWTLHTSKWIRDYLASGKAVWDVVRDRPPAVTARDA